MFEILGAGLMQQVSLSVHPLLALSAKQYRDDAGVEEPGRYSMLNFDVLMAPVVHSNLPYAAGDRHAAHTSVNSAHLAAIVRLVLCGRCVECGSWSRPALAAAGEVTASCVPPE